MTSLAKPRVLFVSRERFRLPLEGTQQRKWDALSAVVDPRVVAAAAPGSPLRDARFRLWPRLRPRLLDGPVFYLALPARVAAALRAFEPHAVLVQGVHEAAAVLAARRLVHSRARVILDVQGDWHVATRLYGSRARRLLNPLSDAIGAGVVPRVDGIRTLSGFTSSVVRAAGAEPLAEFPPFVDAAAFLAPPLEPLPGIPAALFVGVLERYKGFDTLAAAWPQVAQAVPGAQLHVVGRGTLAPLADELARDGARWTESLGADGVSAAMDAATLLCLPSRAEGLGRVVLEAMCRGRSVVGGRAGGIEDLVADSVNGLLVDPDDPQALAAALIAVLGDAGTAARMGEAARRTGEAWSVTPEQYAERVDALLRAVLDGDS
ncbi:MAG TPA: glycosyltransferase family 4 protein [Gaiellaceae bacterium]